MSEMERKVHAQVPYVSDKEMHVSTVRSPDDELFVDLREFIPSLEAYGRGVTFPLRLLDPVLTGFENVWDENGAEAGSGDSGDRGGRKGPSDG